MPARNSRKIDAPLRLEISLLAIDRPNATAPELLAVVTPIAESKGWFVPKVDAVRKIAKIARDGAGPEDSEWSLAASSTLTDTLIPADALPDVLAAWRWHQIGATPFTIRQAKWAARLRGVVGKLAVGYRGLVLAQHALAYASEERACLALTNYSFSSRRLDTDMAHLYAGDTPAGGADWVFATRAREQMQQLIDRQENHKLPAVLAARVVRYASQPDMPELPRASVLDDVAQEVYDHAPRDEEGNPPSWPQINLVVIAIRRDDPTSKSTRRYTIKGMFARIKKRDLQGLWPSNWDMAIPTEYVGNIEDLLSEDNDE